MDKDLRLTLSVCWVKIGEMAATTASGPGGFVSLATGNKLAGDKVKEHLGKICNFCWWYLWYSCTTERITCKDYCRGYQRTG